MVSFVYKSLVCDFVDILMCLVSITFNIQIGLVPLRKYAVKH